MFIVGSLPSPVLALDDPDVCGPVREHLGHDHGERARGSTRQSRVPSVTRHHLASEACRVPDPPAIEPQRRRGDVSHIVLYASPSVSA
jgi:hypothetical protein